MLKNRKDTILIYGLLAAMLLTASALDRDFLSVKNLTNVVVTSLPFIIAAYGQTIAIISGGVDLSMGAMISFATTICATKMRPDTPWGFLPGIFFAIAAGILIGTANGTLAAVFHIQPLIATLSTSLIIGGLDVYKRQAVTNDCRAALAGEQWLGAAVGYQDVTGVILGTGLGGGVISRGRLLPGSFGGLGEIGHMILHPGGRPCTCGQRGCAEQYLSGTALWTSCNQRLGWDQDVYKRQALASSIPRRSPRKVPVLMLRSFLIWRAASLSRF